ncbi:hypothetical protein ONA70_22660 [Micromonospora yasonensis]|uniref:hypothetical protein n=1 Tax=Micromonospora yasonensis TaxID=1128667 RepID=UPI00222F325D|nr:hypothetical protein [Micromonospora yasonensis]MCW3842905.1 hypothetical protein [Micromonospora yasonensis]
MNDHDGTAFRPSVPRALGFLLLSAVAGWLVAQLLLALLFWSPPPDLTSLVVSGVVSVLVFVGVSFLVQRGGWPSVRVTDTALELANRRASVGLPWALVRSAVIRYPGPFATLRVTLHAGVPAPPPGALQPRVRAGHPTYQVHVGTMLPAPAVLRAALTHHLPREAAVPPS